MKSGESADGAAMGADESGRQGPSIRSCANALRDADDSASRRATEALVQMGMELAAALPVLASALQRRRGASRAEAAAELGQLGVRLIAVIPRFRAALRTAILTDSDEAVRTSALHALTLLGPTCTSQVPALVEALHDDLPEARAAAAQDLAQLGTEARESVPALIKTCLNDPDIAVRVQAGAALWRVGHRRLPALPALIEGLRSGDPILCWTAADCLGDMGAEATDAVPDLLEALNQNQRPLIATSIALALERIDSKAADVVQGTQTHN